MEDVCTARAVIQCVFKARRKSYFTSVNSCSAYTTQSSSAALPQSQLIPDIQMLSAQLRSKLVNRAHPRHELLRAQVRYHCQEPPLSCLEDRAMCTARHKRR